VEKLIACIGCAYNAQNCLFGNITEMKKYQREKERNTQYFTTTLSRVANKHSSSTRYWRAEAKTAMNEHGIVFRLKLEKLIPPMFNAKERNLYSHRENYLQHTLVQMHNGDTRCSIKALYERHGCQIIVRKCPLQKNQQTLLISKMV
jgi:hypothetical protein